MQMTTARYLAIFSACGVAKLTAPLQASDKDQYHLFNPTPRELMRELSTDRPDTTESPHTVDAGHVQIEVSFLEYTRDRDEDAFDVMPTNLKIGLTNYADLQLVLQPYLNDEDDGDRIDGFGDTQLRLKVNLWGNDSGATALALMPFVQFPTADDDLGASKVEGGLIIPFGIELPADFSLTLMAEFDCVRNAADDGYRLDFVHTAALGREISGPLGGFVEYIGVQPFDPDDAEDDYEASIAAGLTFGLTNDIQWDCAVEFGLTDAAADFNVRTGISMRF